MPGKPKAKPSIALGDRRLTARPDLVDFRDLMYTPTLVEVPSYRELGDFRKARVPILDQGREGACTGFGLATVVHYLLRTRRRDPALQDISPLMLYDLARRYDEWPGEDYDGSSCRGAMKGWHKHGVCDVALWKRSGGGTLSEAVVNNAARRPLGAYFRVNHRDLVAMHAAITEVGILYVSCNVHSGWDAVGKDGRIKFADDSLGGHAFAIVAYDERGFWLQNSWGKGWGHQGYAHVSYQDWLKNGTDAWVARLAVPIELPTGDSTSPLAFAGTVRAKAWSYNDLRPHVISLGNDGRLDPGGDIGTSPELVREIVRKDIPRITANWTKKRIVLYAHGGLVGEESALQRVADYRKAMLDAECYPLAFIWHSDAWSTIKNILEDAVSRRRPEGFLDAAKDFLLDRLDDALEPLARLAGGRAMWNEMKENAICATTSTEGGARLVLDELAALAETDDRYEFHIVGHSAGSIFHAPVLQYLGTKGAIQGGPMDGQKGLGRKVESATLWAPAITTSLFKEAWLPALAKVGRFALFTLDDDTEQNDNCAGIYHKSLLYLVSNAFEATMRIPLIHPDGEPILGMEKFVSSDPQLMQLFGAGGAEWILSPNANPDHTPSAARARHHGDFDDDTPTVEATLARILGQTDAPTTLAFKASGQRRRSVRLRLDTAAGLR
ncbi:MAG: C1 family peptidase [Rhodocyclales bacterium]|nr:C1 family peptidase [Rhodocyclales bacterium]